MAFPMDSIQDTYFYGLEWPKHMTLELISCLINEKDLGNWRMNSNNLSACLNAREHLKNRFGRTYTTVDVVQRVKILRNRFEVFDRMISVSGVVWEKENNYVFAPMDQWKDWTKAYPISKAYLAQGEPLYDDLKSLFRLGMLFVDGNVIVHADPDSDEDNLPPLPAAVEGLALPAAIEVLALPAVEVAAAPPPPEIVPAPIPPFQIPHVVIEISDDEKELEPMQPIPPNGVIDISDEEEEMEPDSDIELQFTDSEDELNPLFENDEEPSVVIDNEVPVDSEDEVQSPSIMAPANTTLGGSSSSATSPLKARHLFK
ncbi:hypothetical protein ACS0TY_002337 [Phlomoides rotata]